MSALTNVKTILTRTIGRSSLIVRKHSPEILMVVGGLCFVGSTILACRATLKSEAVIDEAKDKFDKIKYAKENVDKERYSDQDYAKDMTIAYVQTGMDFVKLYGPAVALGIASLGCFFGSNRILNKRNVAIAAACKAAETAFENYRKRVIEESGEEKDHYYRYGIRKEVDPASLVDENGKKKKGPPEPVETLDPEGLPSQYAKIFDESCSQWTKTPEYNLTFLRCQQNFANDLLKSRGHVFLNEVYDMLGFPHTQAGALVGWVYNPSRDDGEDDYIDFGLYDISHVKTRDFINGYERSILLDFNVNGIIYDLI